MGDTEQDIPKVEQKIYDMGALEVLEDSGKPFQTPGRLWHDNEISACNRPHGGGYPLIPVCL
jgi:hypothetical protein